jgi:hypothetical protein
MIERPPEPARIRTIVIDSVDPEARSLPMQKVNVSTTLRPPLDDGW